MLAVIRGTAARGWRAAATWGGVWGRGRGKRSQRPSVARRRGPVPFPQGVASASCFLPRRAGRRQPPLISSAFAHFFKVPLFWADVSLANRAGAGLQPQLSPLASVDTSCITMCSCPVWAGPDPEGQHRPPPPTPLALTTKGLRGPPPETGRGALLSEQRILPPLQGLLGLVAQLQVGLRDCGSTGVTWPHTTLLPPSHLWVKAREGSVREKSAMGCRCPARPSRSSTLLTHIRGPAP